ncbi:unnamed protein product [Onchocerca flexuosa]|uniref:Rhodanese domain-containing protein n=1 Tax=Onchocerca flexuosa TaxID=387005 RepID=A0A183I4Q9_9BILA|nr:unnamed protein product [Onchocerca flexuosa]
MKLRNFISTSVVADLLKRGGFKSGSGYRLLDCGGDFEPRNHKDFMKTTYGKFEKMMDINTKQYRDYVEKHIPQAVHIDLNIATYPGLYEPYAMYPPEIFQKYARLLGINQSEHIILYGRQYIAGMMFPCRISWLFKYYGHRAVSVVDGGLAAWEKDGGEITQEIPDIAPGNWRAELCPDYIVTYEQLIEKDSSGMNMFDKSEVNGSRVSGTKCAPAIEMISEKGRLKDPEELRSWLQKCGFKQDLPIVSHCLRGIQACMLNLIIEDLFPSLRPRTYHGSCYELQVRDPKRISE